MCTSIDDTSVPKYLISHHLNDTSPSVSVALRRIGATHLKLTAAMRPYSSLIVFYWFGIFGIDGTSN